MPNYQLALIRQYCDTTKYRLSPEEMDLLCKVLETPAKYDGFISRVYTENDEGKDYRGSWAASTTQKFRIDIDSKLSIHEWYRRIVDGDEDRYECDHTDTRQILNILKRIENEL